ncbi:hypothetical protein CRUP_004370 [Coryphaenoides rupestris]|nr:hypothetical protein CRUP_004370 [Coryphaenoides rupestris]
MLLAQQMSGVPGGPPHPHPHGPHHPGGPHPKGSISDPIPGAKPLPVPPELAALMASAETRTLPRSSSMAAGLERNGRTRVQAIFSHAAGDNSTLLSFSEGDVITLLVPEARDGWHYGENEKNRMRGWFPFSYTRLITDGEQEPGTQLRVHNLISSIASIFRSEAECY